MHSSLIQTRRLAALAATAFVAALALSLPAGAGAFSWQLPATTLPAGTKGALGADVAVAPDGTTTIVTGGTARSKRRTVVFRSVKPRYTG